MLIYFNVCCIFVYVNVYFSFEAVRCQQPKIHLSALEGGSVKIVCSYDSGYETYPKRLSKGDYGERKILIQATKSEPRTQNGKYHLFDDTKNRILYATIDNLNLSDAGTYWCEIITNTYDPKTEIKLKVNKGMSTLSILFLSLAIFLIYHSFVYHSSSLNTCCLSLAAPARLKPPLVTSKPPISTTVQTTTRNQQQSLRTTGYLSRV